MPKATASWSVELRKWEKESGLKALARQQGPEREIRDGLTVTPNRRARASGTTAEQKIADGWRDTKSGQAEKEPGSFGGSATGTGGPARACGAGLADCAWSSMVGSGWLWAQLS